MIKNNKSPVVEANANFHRVAGKDPFNTDSERMRTYRRNWKEWPETFHVGDFPLFLDIEVTSACNLRCPYCAVTYNDEKIDKGYIDPTLVKRVIDEGAANGLYGVKFNYRGEPLLHPDIVEFVAYAKEKGLIDVYFNTNALRLTEKKSRELIDAGLDRISISIEGYTKEVYEAHRVGSNFEKVLENIENLRKLKSDSGVKHPQIRIQTVLLPELLDDMENYKAFWKEKADELAYIDYKEMKERQIGTKYAWACPQLWQRMQIWWDGTIVPCNHDDEAALSPGNVKNISIKTAWNSELINRARLMHERGQAHLIPACDGCYLRDSEIKKLMGATAG